MNNTEFPTYANIFAVSSIGKIQPGDNISELILARLQAQGEALKDGDVIVIAQKIISKVEGRQVDLKHVVPSKKANRIAKQSHKDPRIVELILNESVEIIRIKEGLIITRHHLGLVLANAGIDQSNIEHDPDGSVLLLPKSPSKSCEDIRQAIRSQTKKDVAVLMNDSVGRPWRIGTTSIAIGSAGLTPLLDQRGKTDLFGRQMETAMTAIADQVASMAALIQGECNEGQPIVICRGLKCFMGTGKASDLVRPIEQDLFL